MLAPLVKTSILGVDVTNASKQEVLEYVGRAVKDRSQKLSIVTPNPEMVMFARSHPEFRKVLNNADIALCDGIGLYIAGHILGMQVKEHITGIDMMDSLCHMSSEQALSIGLLGARHGVADRAAKCLREKYPKLKILFIASDWDAKVFPRGGVDILFVAYGVPKQEEWIAKHLPTLPIRVAMAVGGSFDYLSGEVVRAPFIIRMIGFEWLYRLIRQPWRFRRQLALITFVRLVIAKRFNIG